MDRLLSRQQLDTHHVLALCVWLVGLVLRLYWLSDRLPMVDGDDALVGVFAFHIQQGHPALFYGDHNGTLEAFAAALAFQVFGPSQVTLRGVALVFSAVTLVGVYLLGRMASPHPAVGLFALTWLAVPPLVFLNRSIKPQPGYPELLAVGTVTLCLAAVWLSGRTTSRRGQTWVMGALGLMAGMGVWTNLLIAPYLAAILLAALSQPAVLKRSPRNGYILMLAGVILVGVLPMLFAAVADPAENPVHYLLHAPYSPVTWDKAYRIFTRWNLPISLGARWPDSKSDLFSPSATGALKWLFLASLAWGVYRGWKGRAPAEQVGLRLAWGLVAATVAANIITPFGALKLDPRYLSPMISGLPVLYGSMLADGLGRFRLARPLAIVGGCALLLVNGIGLAPYRQIEVYNRQPDDDKKLVSFLMEHDLRYMFTQYWIVMTAAFESHEQIIGSSLAGPNRANYYRPYEEAVLKAKGHNTAYVFFQSSPSEQAFRQKLGELEITYWVANVGCYVVFYDFSRFPWYDELDLPVGVV